MRAWDEARRPYFTLLSCAEILCSLCNEIKCHIDEAKVKYLLNRSSITNSARFWAELRSLGFAKSKTTNSFLKFSLDLNSLLSLFPLIFCFLHFSYLFSSLLLIFAYHCSQFIVPLLTPAFLILPFLTLLIYPFQLMFSSPFPALPLFLHPFIFPSVSPSFPSPPPPLSLSWVYMHDRMTLFVVLSLRLSFCWLLSCAGFFFRTLSNALFTWFPILCLEFSVFLRL